MPTNEERREVAARLRELAHNNSWLNGATLTRAIDVDIESVGFVEADVITWSRLADLIEPEERTCHKELMIWFFPATELTTQREVEYFGCSKCGEWLSDTDCYGLDDGPFYCSNCGCKVDPSFVTDEVTGDVIYRDGERVKEGE